MSIESPVAQSANVFIGEDRILEYTVLDSTNSPVNVSGWNFDWTLRTSVDASTALLTKATTDANPDIHATNPGQGVVQVTLHDSDTYDDAANPPAIVIQPGRYVYALRRIDAGAESVLAFGDFVLQLSAAR